MKASFLRSTFVILFFGLAVFKSSPGLSQPADTTSSDSSSFFRISAIKTVSGIRPDDEFFDIFLKWSWGEHWFALGSFDIALTNTGTDSASSKSRELTEAGFFLNYACRSSADKRRQAFVGVGFKQFDAITYFGGQVGALELTKSIFYGSYITASVLRRLYDVDSTANARAEVKEHPWNLYFEFGIHSTTAPVLRALIIKAGILIPLPGLNGNPDPVSDDVKTRIVIEIPLKGIVNF